jgi:uncharacterized protein (UPF0333 family)
MKRVPRFFGGLFATSSFLSITLYTSTYRNNHCWESWFFMIKRGSCSKAQVSMEFLMIVGFALLMTLPLFFIFYKQSEQMNSEIIGGQIDKVTSEIRDEGINNVSFSTNSMIFNMNTASGNYEVVKWTVGNISASSNIYSHNGIHHISIESRSYDVFITDS